MQGERSGEEKQRKAEINKEERSNEGGRRRRVTGRDREVKREKDRV